MRSRRLALATIDHGTAISCSGGGRSGNRRLPSRPLLPRNDDERIDSGSLSVSDGDAVESLSPRAPPNNMGPLGVLTGVIGFCGVAAQGQQKTYRRYIILITLL